MASVMQIQAIGRPFKLGMLYDCRSDTLIPGITLWSKEKLEKDLTVKKESTQSMKIEASDNLSDKASLINIDAYLKLSFLGGLVSVSGSAKYLDDRISSSHQERVTLKYECTTKFEHLSMQTLAVENIDYPTVFDKQDATHVVTGIQYGARALFLFDKQHVSSEEKRKVGGAVEVIVKSIPSFQIEGGATLDLKDEQKEVSKSLNCTFYGDVRPKTNPTTFEEAIQVYKGLNELVGEHGEPLTIWLYPLEKLDSKAAKLAREISSNLISQVETIFEGFQDIFVWCNDLIKEANFSAILAFKKLLENFKSLVKQKQLAFQKELLPILPRIKGGFEAESVLANLILKMQKSPFSFENLSVWVKDREKQLKIITTICKSMEGIKFASAGDLEAAIMDPENHHVLCYMFEIPASDEQMAAMQDYLNFGSISEINEPASKIIKLSDEKENQQKMQTVESATLFRDFYNANKNRVMDIKKKTAFLISDISSFSQKVSGSIYHYRKGEKISTEFLPPSPPENIEITNINHNSVNIKWNPSIPGTEDIVTYEIEYQTVLEGSVNESRNIKATDKSSTKFILSQLSPATAYQFKCRSVVPSGFSSFCDLSLPVVTLPSSSPILKRVSQVDDKVVQIEFEEPAIKVDNIVIKGYHIYYKTCYEGSWEGPIEVASDEGHLKNIEVEVNETYMFKIRAVYDIEHHQGYPEESQDSKISPSIYIVKNLNEFLEKTAIFRDGLENTAKKLYTFESDNDFKQYCQQNLQDLWEHAKYVPEFWRQLLQKDTFCTFFKLIIDYKDVFDDNDKHFIRLLLRQLLNLADDVEFSYCSDLNDWVNEQTDSSENHKKALHDLDETSKDLVKSDEFLSKCKILLEEVLVHARFVPVFWKAFLIQGKFSNFFSKLISCKDSLVGDSVIQHYLRQLIGIAEDTAFAHRENLINIAFDQEGNINEQEEYTANDLPSFISLMNETLLPQFENKLKILIPKSINLINYLTNCLPKSEDIHQRYQGCLLKGLLMKHDIYSARFDDSFPIDDLRSLVNELMNNWNLFQEYADKGEMQCQALIFVMFIKCVECRADAASIYRAETESVSPMDTRCDEEEFNNQVQIIGEGLTPEVQQIIDKWAKTSPFHWKELKKGFQSLEKGDKSILIKETYIIEEIKVVKETQDHEKEEGIEYFDASQSVEALNNFQYLNNILQMLGLKDFYPSKISLWDITKIKQKKSNCDGHDKKQITDIPWQIMQKLIMIDFTGRESIFNELGVNDAEGDEFDEMDYFLDDMAESTEDAMSLNPLDAFLATFLCCNPMLKQIIIGKMFSCKLAIPFIYPVGPTSLGLSIWSLRSIITEWRGRDKTATEKSVLNFPLHIVSFQRIKRPSASKSKLINDVLNNQAHHTFFNQDSIQGMTEKKFCDGMVEASWFLPSGKETSTFSDVLMFLNLRGDCSDHKEQSQFLSIASTVPVIMIDAEDVTLDTSKETLGKILKTSQDAIVILSSCANPPDKKIIKAAGLKIKELDIKEAPHKVKIILGFKPDGRKSAADLKNEIRIAISERISKTTTQSITECVSLAENNGLHFIIDENDTAIKKGKRYAEEVFQYIKDIPLDECKKQMLPLQGETWQKWSKLLKQQYRVGGKSPKESSMQQKGIIGMDMVNLREEQLRRCQNSSALFRSFRENLMMLVEQGDSVMYFLQWLRIFLDDKSRNSLPELSQRYKTSWWRFREGKNNPDEAKISLDQLKIDAERAEQQLADASCGLEHLLRELAQMYETVATSTNIPKKTKDSYEQIPLIAAKLLLKGQPLEIMDGDAANVPLTWVQAVFEGLRKCIGDKKLFVLSVLGIQSSGKSTLLNTMFGLQFAVSAGRCTRGVFMQLVPVDKKNTSFQFDYVLVVDTEGLRAPELGQQKYDHDNELATLVIGLGDVTILNIKGENTAEVRDVLQIAVHAFLRMKIVNHNLKIRQSCVFLHQNVPAVNAKEKMEHGHRKLQEDLDEMTKEAAYQEKFVNIKSFNEVIEYDGEKHVFYFSDLWHGDPPMAPANPGYSENVEKLRDWLLEELDARQKTFYTVSDMKLRIEDLWNGVMADDFVFSFRNSLEIKAYRGLEDKFCHLIFIFEQNIGNWLKSIAEVEMSKCLTAENLQNCHSKLITTLRQEIDNQGHKCYEDLDTYFEESNLKDIIIQWKEQKKVALELSINDMTFKIKEEMQKMKESIQLDLYQRENEKVHEDEIMRKANQLAENLRNKKVTDTYLDNEFNKLWIRWTNELALRETANSIPIEVEVENLLYKYQKDINMNLNQELTRKPLKTPLGLKKLENSILFKDVTSKYISVSSYFGSRSNGSEYQVEMAKSKEDHDGDSWWNPFSLFGSKKTTQSQKKAIKGHTHLTELEKKQRLEKKCRYLAVKIINQILGKVDIYIVNKFRQDTGFRNAYASEVINIIVTDIKKHNNATTHEYPFTFLPNLRAKISVHACAHAVECFKKLESAYQEKHGIKAKREVYKGKAWKLFINKVKKSSEEITAAALFWECLKEWIRKQVSKEMERKIPADIVQEFSLKKYHLLLRILDNLADEGSIDDYKGYIMDAFSYAKTWMKEYIEDQLFAKGNSGHNSKYSLDADIKIGSTMHIVQKAIEIATNVVTEERSKRTLEDMSDDMKIWIRQFCSHLQEKNLPINFTILGTLKDSNVTDFTNLQKQILKQLDEEQNSQRDYFKCIDKSTVRWEGESPVVLIMEKLWGCPAQCPFCQEPCLWMKNHEGQSHTCLQHRPQGVGGRFWLDSNKLVTENCNWMVNSTDRKFVCTKRTLEEAYNEAQKVDLAFLVDSTGSMGGIIQTVKEEIHRIVNKIKDEYPEAQLRVAFVGYRDHCDGSDRIQKMDFTNNISSFRSFVSDVNPTGGGDAAEDVFGGLEEAGKLSWTAVNRVIVHFADAPCHGSRFHNGVNDDYSNYNKADFRGLKIEELMAKLIELDVQYYFGKMNHHTNKMIDEFRLVSGDKNFPRQVDATNAANVLTIVANSVTATIHETMDEWLKKGSSGVVSTGEDEEKRICKDVWHKYKHYKTCLPKWDIAPDPSTESSQYWQWFMYTYSDDLQEFHGARLPDMPVSWRKIDAEKAKESLRKYCT
ncbi:unnamed protein product [Meganyctiphanes norvegica]|uniref:Interferon-induced very large GTPase 1-like n=1 Tax=Meganyctiphanes norvegica TaxID=48144 RepID=A0AAV2QWB7_MEGNR